MDFEKLVSPISEYLTFAVGFWTGNAKVFDAFMWNEAISSKALLFSIVGVGVYLVLRYAKFGVVPVDPHAPQQPGPSLDSNSLLFFISLSLMTPLLIELTFWILGTRKSLSIGTPFDTINASMLSSALLMPISGFLGRLSHAALELQKVGGRFAKVAKAIEVSAHMAVIYLAFVCFGPFFILHGATVRDLLLPLLVTAVITVLLTGILVYALFRWNLFVSTR